jgi:hypothetical protein
MLLQFKFNNRKNLNLSPWIRNLFTVLDEKEKATNNNLTTGSVPKTTNGSGAVPMDPKPVQTPSTDIDIRSLYSCQNFYTPIAINLFIGGFGRTWPACHTPSKGTQNESFLIQNVSISKYSEVVYEKSIKSNSANLLFIHQACSYTHYKET